MTDSRITIMINIDIQKKLRHIQAKQLQLNEGSVSFSNVVHQVLVEGLKKFK